MIKTYQRLLTFCVLGLVVLAACAAPVTPTTVPTQAVAATVAPTQESVEPTPVPASSEEVNALKEQIAALQVQVADLTAQNAKLEDTIEQLGLQKNAVMGQLSNGVNLSDAAVVWQNAGWVGLAFETTLPDYTSSFPIKDTGLRGAYQAFGGFYETQDAAGKYTKVPMLAEAAASDTVLVLYESPHANGTWSFGVQPGPVSLGSTSEQGTVIAIWPLTDAEIGNIVQAALNLNKDN